MRKFAVTLLLVFISFVGQAQLKIDGQLRPRFEFRDGYKSPKTDSLDPAMFTTQRTRLNLQHEHDNITTRISIQDYRIWGESKLKSDDLGIGLYEAYMKLKINEGWSVTAGRQAINIDNKRLFSSANWNQVGASHDGVRLDYKNDAFNFMSLTAFNQATVSNHGTDYTNQISNYKFLNTVWLEQKFGDFSIANLSITDGYQKIGTQGTDYYRFTSGLVLKHKNDSHNYEGRGFYQTGTKQSGQEVEAMFGNIIIANKVSEFMMLTVGSEYMSGNDYTDTANIKDNAFDILYGAKHSFNGNMDYFSTPKTTKHAGLIDSYLKLDYTQIKDLKLSAHYHYLMLSNNYVSNGETLDKFLAHEIDFVGNWKINNIASLQLGYGVIFGEETLDVVKGVEGKGLQQFVYAMLTVKPTFFEK